jgi:hypothetical protein
MVWPHLQFDDEREHPLGHDRTPDPVEFDTEMFEFYRSAIALRRTRDALRYGDFSVLIADDEAQTLAFRRSYGDEQIVVMINRSDSAQRIHLADSGLDVGPLDPIFASRGEVALIPSLNITLDERGITYSNELPPRTVVVFTRVESDLPR